MPRYWLPCVDHPSIRTPLDFHLTFPASFTHILANGELVSEETNPSECTRTAHWHQEYPCPSYLSMLRPGGGSACRLVGCPFS